MSRAEEKINTKVTKSAKVEEPDGAESYHKDTKSTKMSAVSAGPSIRNHQSEIYNRPWRLA